MTLPPPSVPPQELRVAQSRSAYRWPLRLCLAALAFAALVAVSARSAPWNPGDAPRVVLLYEGGGVLVALAAVAWAVVMFRNRLVVTIGGKGLVLRRGRAEASVPVSALEAVGIAWPVTDPVWTVWFDPAAAPDVAAVTKVDGRAAALLRDGVLRPGRLDAVRDASTATFGVPWRVVDDAGEDVPPPAADALTRADRVIVDGRCRYRNERGGALLAVACGRLVKQATARNGFVALNPDRGRRTIVLRDPHAERLLVFERTSRLRGRGRMRVLDADGRLVGRIRGSHEPSFHSADGTLLGTTRGDGGRYVVTGVDGRESASLRTKSGADDGRMWLHRSPSAPDALRALTLALPMVVRIARQSS